MANNVIKRIWNQNKMVQIEDLKGMAFQAEDGGHTFEIYGVNDAGDTVALSGTPSGVFLRPDNTDVVLSCSVSGGVVSATLPDECYDVPGRGGLTVFITDDGKKTALYAAVVTVSRTSSGNVAPPATQTVVDLVNAISAAVATIPASYSALMADIAPTYSTSALYAVGQYAWYDGDLKRCIVPITTAESYTAAHWTSAVLGNDVSDLKSALFNITGNAEIQFSDPTLKQYINTNVAVGTIVSWDTPSTSSATNIKWAVVECNAGDQFTLNGKGGNGDRLWAFLDVDKKLISKSDANITVQNLLVTAPADSKYIVINDEINKESYYGKLVSIMDTMTSLTSSDDIRKLTKVGFYIWGNSSPLDGESQLGGGTGMLLNMQSTATRTYQIWITATGKLSYRNKTDSTTWSDWRQVLKLSDIVQTSGASETAIMSQKAVTELVTSAIANAISPITETITSKAFLNASLGSDKDLDTVYANGFYTWGNTGPANRPVSGGGALLNIMEGNTYTRHYQLCMTYNDAALYVRHQTAQDAWTEWKKVSDQVGPDGTTHAGTIEKTSSQYDIKMHKSRFIVKHEENASTNADLWRIYSGWISTGTNWQSLWTGSDADGVVKLVDEDDFIGGAHGDEVFTSMNVYIDGNLVTDSTFNAIDFDEVLIFAESNVYHCGSETIAFRRNKIIQFNKDGCTVKNYWVAQENLIVLYAYFGMLSVNRYKTGEFTDVLLNGYTTNGDFKLRDAVTAYSGGEDVTECIMQTVYGDFGISVKGMSGGDYDGYVTVYDTDSSKRVKTYFGPINDTSGVQISQGTILKGETLFFVH